MKNMIKKIKKMLIPYVKQMRNFYILALEYGQFKTIKFWKNIDKYGNSIPWFTYPAIEYLNHIDLSECSIFEYGSGYSTLYWMNKAKWVVSVEHNEEWYNEIKHKVTNKVIYIFEKVPERYMNSIERFNKKFDIYVIDGRWRGKCAKKVVEHINHYGGSMVIFDNSDWYPNTINFLRNELKWIEIDFAGFGPINNYTWVTTIFINPEYRLKYYKNLSSVGGLIQLAEGD
jgi:hypothetical protein